ncbi:AbrB/MazE/SpoVT family DNA-binding domain-containing protein [Halobacillus sp. A1]|uniref:AbrB/MazE/SpoVT family DNA-binding domain-containing protein n=1 Tax=Halobacillus sp. A1 TaxID=2880262 RepID=UPI0020A66E3D|nr:AbrB/MazE/SpoVT family DNA-binding domain-containing protein [Halobacillus sp. A1]MCP3033456.1 AbrB/MazE/SpoVT family DNA-binding domain-containing protein [Halobacillus sp. A1]
MNCKPNKDNEEKKKKISHLTTFRKWGNSLAIRIPNQFVRNQRLTNGSQVELLLHDKVIIVKPATKKPTLEELLLKAKGKTNPHMDDRPDEPKGKEMI